MTQVPPPQRPMAQAYGDAKAQMGPPPAADPMAGGGDIEARVSTLEQQVAAIAQMLAGQAGPEAAEGGAPPGAGGPPVGP